MTDRAETTINLERLREVVDKTTAEEIAEKFECSRSYISHQLNGTRKMTVENLKLFCEYFSVSADYLLDLTDVPCRNTPQQEAEYRNQVKKRARQALDLALIALL